MVLFWKKIGLVFAENDESNALMLNFAPDCKPVLPY